MRVEARNQESEVSQHPAARSVLECGGKRSATPLSLTDRFHQALQPKRRRRCALPAHSKTWRLGLLCFCFLLSAFGFRAWGQFSLDWSTIDGGGGTSTGGVYSVSGTIGQADAGQMSGGQFTLTGGFWSIIAAVQTPGAPLLSVTRTATNSVIVSWPDPSTGFELQENPDLDPAHWVKVATPPAVVGGQKQVVVPAPVGIKFYRLRKPGL